MKVKLYDAAQIHICDVCNVDSIEVVKGYLSLTSSKSKTIPTLIGYYNLTDFNFEVVEDDL